MTAQAKTSRQAAFEKRSGREPLIYHLTDAEADFIRRFQTNTVELYGPGENIDDLGAYNEIVDSVIRVARRLRRTIAAHHNGVEFFRITENDREDGKAML